LISASAILRLSKNTKSNLPRCVLTPAHTAKLASGHAPSSCRDGEATGQIVVLVVFSVGVFCIGMTAEQFFRDAPKEVAGKEPFAWDKGRGRTTAVKAWSTLQPNQPPDASDQLRIVWAPTSRLGQFSTRVKHASSENSTAW
jgi:hypothetical protein